MGVRTSRTGTKTLMFELSAINGTVNFCEPLGCGGMPPRKFSNRKALKRNLFPALSGR